MTPVQVIERLTLRRRPTSHTHGLVVLQALLVGRVDLGVIHRAVRADVDAGVLVKLMAIVADRDRPGPVLPLSSENATWIGERPDPLNLAQVT